VKLIAGANSFDPKRPETGEVIRIVGSETASHLATHAGAGYVPPMSSVLEIQEAIKKLSPKEKSTLAVWLESQEEPVMSAAEEAALLARLDRAAGELDAGKGVPLEQVQAMVGRWVAK
jgi:hypothetical protein